MVGTILLATNLLIAHAGRLLQANDVPAEGTHTLTVTVYKSVNGGDPVWTDDFQITCDKSGAYGLMLGDVDARQKAITENDLGPEQRWMAVKVDRSAELQPRMPFGVVPLAARALVASSLSSAPQTISGPMSFQTAPAFAASGQPFTVAAGAATVDNLSAKLLDGHPASDFVLKAAESCPTGQAVVGTKADGTISCASTFVTKDAVAGLGAQACPAGKVVAGMNADGSLSCSADFVAKSAVAGLGQQQCAVGQVVVGMNADGSQKCGRVSAGGGGLRASYDFEEGSGTTSADNTGGGSTLALSPSGASWTTAGHTGKALNFDGSSGTAAAAASPAVDFAEYAALEAWVYIPASVNGAMTVVAREGAYRLGVVNMQVQAGFDTAASPSTPVWVGAGPVQTGTWTHLAATYDGVSVRTFVNGRQSSETAWAYGPIKASTRDLTIGSRGSADYFNGKIDEVRLAASPVRFPNIARNNLVCGLTGTTTGNLGGWTGAGVTCQNTCRSATAHVCTNHEILRSYQAGASLPVGGAWIASANAVASVTGGTGASFTQGSVSGNATYMTNYRGCCNWDTGVYAVNGVTLPSVTMPSPVASTTLSNCNGWTGSGFGQTAGPLDLGIAACSAALPVACCD